ALRATPPESIDHLTTGRFMPDTTCHMSISLDGFVAGPDQSRENTLRAWMFNSLPAPRRSPRVIRALCRHTAGARRAGRARADVERFQKMRAHGLLRRTIGRQRAIVCQRETGDVPGYQREDLDVPDR